VSGFQHNLFHGLASRYSNFLKQRPEDVTLAKQKELGLVLNLFGTAKIIQPLVNLLVQNHVRRIIGNPEGCTWKPVRVERMCKIR